MANAHGEQDDARLFELSSRLHRVALRPPVRHEDGDPGRGGGVAAAREALPQRVLEGEARLGGASPGSSEIGRAFFYPFIV